MRQGRRRKDDQALVKLGGVWSDSYTLRQPRE